MAEVASAVVSLIPSFRGGGPTIASELDRYAGPAGTQAGRTFGSGFAASARSLIGPMLASISVGAAVDFLSGSIEEASGLNESLNALSVTYGRNAQGVMALGEAAADSLGLSNLEFNNLAVRFSSFANTIDGSNVVGTLDDLTTRASDFASVMNLDVADAAALFQSGLAGESEPLLQYGIDLKAATVQAYAYANGIAEQGTQLTEAQRIQATYGSLMEQTSNTAGDFANTSDQLANQQRIMQARLADARAELGEAFLPILTSVTEYLANTVVPAFSTFARWVSENQWIIGVLAGIIGTTLVVAFTTWAASIWLANIALLANPITWIVAAIVVLIGALVLLIMNWEAVTDWLANTWNNAVTWAGDALSSFGEKIRDFFAGLPGRILDWVGDMGSLLLNAGKDLINGLINGVLSMIPGLEGHLFDITNLIPEWKGPPGKDAKLLRPAGRLIMGGLMRGIDDQRDGLQRTLRGVSDVIAGQQYAGTSVGSGTAAAAAAGSPLTIQNYGVDANELAAKTRAEMRDWQHGMAVAYR